MLLAVQHGEKVYSPPVVDGVQIEWERTGSPGKLTFTTLKVSGLNFTEGDTVCFYYNDKAIFKGYVFKKKRDREQKIEVTCYDQIRYLKNKFTYVFEKKTATQIIKALCADFSLKVGSMDNTKYVIPAIAEENKSALDIILNVLDETLATTGDMFVLYDDAGTLKLKNCANMTSTTLIMEETAENFDYTSSIDDETYNSIVLYYDPNNNITDSVSGASKGASTIIAKAASQIGTCENPNGSNKVKYNTDYYGSPVSGSAYPWCCAFVWWVFKECGMSQLFNGGAKTAYCPTAANWYKNQGQWVTKNYQPGDVVFFDWGGGISHIGIVESVSGSTVVCIEGNTGNAVKRVNRTSGIVGAGRPNYNSLMTRMAVDPGSSSKPTTSTTKATKVESPQVFTAQSKSRIKDWGLLRYFEKIDKPSIGQNKANSLLKLYNRKTRELKVTGVFGDPTIRGGSLIPVRLNLGDVKTNNYMLVQKVVHNFNNDHHSMDLTLEGGWDS